MSNGKSHSNYWKSRDHTAWSDNSNNAKITLNPKDKQSLLASLRSHLTIIDSRTIRSGIKGCRPKSTIGNNYAVHERSRKTPVTAPFSLKLNFTDHSNKLSYEKGSEELLCSGDASGNSGIRDPPGLETESGNRTSPKSKSPTNEPTSSYISEVRDVSSSQRQPSPSATPVPPPRYVNRHSRSESSITMTSVRSATPHQQYNQKLKFGNVALNTRQRYKHERWSLDRSLDEEYIPSVHFHLEPSVMVVRASSDYVIDHPIAPPRRRRTSTIKPNQGETNSAHSESSSRTTSSIASRFPAETFSCHSFNDQTYMKGFKSKKYGNIQNYYSEDPYSTSNSCDILKTSTSNDASGVLCKVPKIGKVYERQVDNCFSELSNKNQLNGSEVCKSTISGLDPHSTSPPSDKHNAKISGPTDSARVVQQNNTHFSEVNVCGSTTTTTTKTTTSSSQYSNTTVNGTSSDSLCHDQTNVSLQRKMLEKAEDQTSSSGNRAAVSIEVSFDGKTSSGRDISNSIEITTEISNNKLPKYICDNERSTLNCCKHNIVTKSSNKGNDSIEDKIVSEGNTAIDSAQPTHDQRDVINATDVSEPQKKSEFIYLQRLSSTKNSPPGHTDEVSGINVYCLKSEDEINGSVTLSPEKVFVSILKASNKELQVCSNEYGLVCRIGTESGLSDDSTPQSQSSLLPTQLEKAEKLGRNCCSKDASSLLSLAPPKIESVECLIKELSKNMSSKNEEFTDDLRETAGNGAAHLKPKIVAVPLNAPEISDATAEVSILDVQTTDIKVLHKTGSQFRCSSSLTLTRQAAATDVITAAARLFELKEIRPESYYLLVVDRQTRAVTAVEHHEAVSLVGAEYLVLCEKDTLSYCDKFLKLPSTNLSTLSNSDTTQVSACQHSLPARCSNLLRERISKLERDLTERQRIYERDLREVERSLDRYRSIASKSVDTGSRVNILKETVVKTGDELKVKKAQLKEAEDELNNHKITGIREPDVSLIDSERRLKQAQSATQRVIRDHICVARWLEKARAMEKLKTEES